MSKEHLNHRLKSKQKKPTFTRQDAHKKTGLAKGWRRPRGIQSKMRLQKKGYKSSPSRGWGSPRKVRTLTREGLVPVMISSVEQIQNLDAKKDAALISGKLGKKRKLELIEELLKKKISIINIKEPQKYADKVKKEFEDKVSKKKEEKKKQETKKEKKEEKEKTETKTDNKEEEPQDQKKKDKKQLDKVLSKPNA